MTQLHTQPLDRKAMECPGCRQRSVVYNTKTGEWHCTRPECADDGPYGTYWPRLREALQLKEEGEN